ncbi:unnamed protein product [Caenorhabditis auriculariae]|uniref:Rho-GAP domain-containing protein n=1 Tax=Caenorhabditis auriculariae TaxID=2777116 RepID=A0A8S1H606_9PELO|nr:unnamed protein product [Caenorhabditis auriculariae]
MLDEPEKKKKGPLRLVSRKSTRKMLGKWKKLDNGEKSDNESFNGSIEETFSATLERRKVFGLPLREAVDADPSLDGVRLPSFFRYSIDFIEEHGLSLEGIYRVSPPKSRLDELERRANAGESLTFADAHDAAGLIKRFLRQLPEPLLPVEFERLAETCRCNLYMASTPSSSVFCRCGAATAMRDVFASLEVERSTLTTYVFLHARHVVQNERENKMGIPALGLLLQTILDMSRKLVCFCLNAIKPFDDGIVDGASYILDADAQIFK